MIRMPSPRPAAKASAATSIKLLARRVILSIFEKVPGFEEQPLPDLPHAPQDGGLVF
jgi:hypothetical protein